MKDRETHSKGMVVYTVTSPATAPMPKVIALESGWFGRPCACTSCLSVVYVVNRTAEFAPCRIICTEKIQDRVSMRWTPKRTTGKSPR